MLPSAYAALVNEPHPLFISSEEAAEKKQPYLILTERHLQAMWLEQKYFKNLKTSHNETIEVLSPGIWNSEAGPDFLKAHIKIGSQEWRGDIELHLSQEGWYHHNHHTDVNYNNVVLHVCYRQPTKERPSLTSTGKVITPTYLQSFLTISEARILKLIDLDLYPYKHFSGSGNCSRSLFAHLPKEKATDLLRSAAVWRLKEKIERLKTQIDSPQNYLIGGIAMVLGYKHNAETFLTVFNALHLFSNSEQTILAIALGMSNFFNPHFQKKWSNSIYYKQLLNQFQLHGNDNNLPLISLKLTKIRPANHPVRRLAALAKMMSDPEMPLLEKKILSLWNSQLNLDLPKKWKKLKKSLENLLPSYSDNYWEYHYTFEKIKKTKRIALVGNDLKIEILINVCMPLLYAHIDKVGTESEKLAFISFYSSLPASKTKKSIYLNYRFFGDKMQRPSFTHADLQQGAYQIHRDFCIHFEASCQGCPFVERYKHAFLTQSSRI